MNKETYEALKRVMDKIRELRIVKGQTGFNGLDIVAIETWIDEVAKEYTE